MCTIQIQDRLANVFTKGLSGAQFMFLIGNLGMIDIYSPVEGEYW